LFWTSTVSIFNISYTHIIFSCINNFSVLNYIISKITALLDTQYYQDKWKKCTILFKIKELHFYETLFNSNNTNFLGLHYFLNTYFKNIFENLGINEATKCFNNYIINYSTIQIYLFSILTKNILNCTIVY